MSAGTLTLTNNSAAVSGSGTAFTTELSAGDFIVVTVGGVPYTLPVKSVESGTALTLVSNFTGPTQSGAAWSAVPRVALNMVTAALVTQSAEALRGLNYDKQNWQQVFSGAGTITVRLPDGTTFTGPSWKYLADNMATKINGAVPLDQGGLGSTTPEGGRKTLGLGSAAQRDVGTGANQIPDMNSFTSGPGWMKFPSGIIIQYGNKISSASDSVAVSFPIPFPTQCFGVTGAGTDVNFANIAGCQVIDKAVFFLSAWNVAAGSVFNRTGTNISWIAVGV
ncbi:gp53-like domain-containing protein [Citrobacter portucalensis]|uniref:gp53-like domain-containing protein n=1 Tax=Citrobacter portucalensis TaxID=1639133 RepID=UPI0035C7AFEA